MGHGHDGTRHNGLSWPLSMMAAVIRTHLHGLVRLGVLVVLLLEPDHGQRHQDASRCRIQFFPVHTAVAGLEEKIRDEAALESAEVEPRRCLRSRRVSESV